MRTLGLHMTVLSMFILTWGTNAQPVWKGQVSAWAHYAPDHTLPYWLGVRYLPQANYETRFGNGKLLDFEASANLQAHMGLLPFSESQTDASAKAYRAWARYSSDQWELRGGLQKINFGSATLLRPLMWFDKIDPRDPLQLTDGIWGLLGRYYFLNNANLWLWTLWGNKDAKTWETGPTDQAVPEMGGRFQTPLPKGEAALTYHFRKAGAYGDGAIGLPPTPEHRVGLDAKWDLTVGLWFEGAWIHKTGQWGMLRNQHTATVGADYTFAIGSGLHVTAEHLAAAYGKKTGRAEQSVHFSALSTSYPLGMFANLSAMAYIDWRNGRTYNFLTYKRDIAKFKLYLMAYHNPNQYDLPMQNNQQSLFEGTGCQAMLVFDY